MKLARLSVLRPIAMAMVIILILILGSVSVKNMTVDLFPELSFPIAVVTATYDGASPREIENLISSPLENIMGTIPNVESVSSISRTGGTLILVSFKWGTDMNFASLKMREKVDAVRELLPSGVPSPKVLRFNPSDIPIMQLAVTDPGGKVTDAKRIAETEVKPTLDAIEGIASVSIEGGAEKEIRLTVDPDKLANYKLTLEQLQQIIGSENLNLPAGSITDRNQTLPIRVTGEFQSLYDIQSLPIPTNQGVLPLSQLVEIKETLRPRSQLSYLNDEPAVGISILKQSGANTVKVNAEISKKINELKEKLPEGIKVEAIFDQALFINQSIRAVLSNMIIGSVLAALVLFLFLRNFRSTLIIGLAIPISILTTFVFMYFSNQTLNLLTLGGLALGIGMMVDNAIVILENIFRLRQNGASLKEAAIKGTTEIGPAIIASTLTTIIVFLPIIFVQGLAAQLFKPLAMVISFSLFASLFTALIFVPLLSSVLLKLKDDERSPFEHKSGKIANFYERSLERALSRPKLIIVLTLTAFIASFAGTPFIGKEFLPAQDQSFINITAKLPPGSSLNATYEVSEEINQRIEEVAEIDLLFVTVGGTDQFTFAAGSQLNRANYSILLKPLNARTRSDLDVAEDIRTRLKDVPHAVVEVSASDSGFSESPISLKVTGPDLSTLEDLSNQIISLIQEVDGVREPRSNYSTGSPEIVVDINRTQASFYGIGGAQVATTIHNATAGIIASRMAREGEELNIRLTVSDEYTSSTTALSELLIDTPLGGKIPLKAIADINRGVGPSQITRTDRLREITITASLLNRDLGSVIDDIEVKLKNGLTLPSNQYKITFGGQDEQMRDAFFKLSLALALAVVLVYMVMAGQFESFFYPFVIMFSIPITAIGIIVGLLITFQPLGVGSLVGMLILTGIVVNNAIVLVDYINLLKKEGLSTKDAILKAGPTRLRPILMTALTTVLGLIPLTLGFGEGTEIQQPMAIVIVFGLSFATFITLIFIPVIYYTFDQLKEKRRVKKLEAST